MNTRIGQDTSRSEVADRVQGSEARIVSDINLVLGCAVAIGLFAVVVLIAYLWTL